MYPINMACGVGYACANNRAEFDALQLMGYVPLGAGPVDEGDPAPIINEPPPSDPAPIADQPDAMPKKRGRPRKVQ